MSRWTIKGLMMAFACSLAILPLGACGRQLSEEEIFEAEKPEETQVQHSGEGVDLASLKTMADVQALESDMQTSTYNDQYYVYVAYVGGAPIRAIAAITPEISQQLGELDITDAEYDTKLAEVVGPLQLVTVEDLSTAIPKQEELDTLIGKTGQELLDSGYTFVSLTAYGPEIDTVAQMDKGLYRFDVTFNEHVSEDLTSEDASVIAGMTVKSVTFAELSDVAVNPAG